MGLLARRAANRICCSYKIDNGVAPIPTYVRLEAIDNTEDRRVNNLQSGNSFHLLIL